MVSEILLLLSLCNTNPLLICTPVLVEENQIVVHMCMLEKEVTSLEKYMLVKDSLPSKRIILYVIPTAQCKIV